MVGSRGTWNRDEPGLGRPKALPSSMPCRASVIWMVLSRRHMPVNVHRHWLATNRGLRDNMATRHLHKSPALPPCHTSIHLCPPITPLLTLDCQSLSLSPFLFPSSHDNVFSLWSRHASNRTRPLTSYMILDVLGVYRSLNVCLNAHVRLGLMQCMGVNLLS